MASNATLGVKTIFLAAAVAACVSGTARADDSSMSRFGGDSYNYLNNLNVDRGPSMWRQTNRQGLSEKALESYSSEALGNDLQANQPAIAASPAGPSFRQTHPDGLSERELQALSSEGPAWQRPFASKPGPNATTWEKTPGVAQSASRGTFAQRLAAFFRLRSSPQTDGDR